MFKFGVPGYLRKILDNYQDNRILLYDTNEGLQRSAVSRGVPQGSVLGPILWNAMYNGVLSIGLPEGVSYTISAFRVACSYRTVSCHAICVISSMIPVELLAQEQVNLYAVLHPEKNVENTIKESLELVN